MTQMLEIHAEGPAYRLFQARRRTDDYTHTETVRQPATLTLSRTYGEGHPNLDFALGASAEAVAQTMFRGEVGNGDWRITSEQAGDWTVEIIASPALLAECAEAAHSEGAGPSPAAVLRRWMKRYDRAEGAAWDRALDRLKAHEDAQEAPDEAEREEVKA